MGKKKPKFPKQIVVRKEGTGPDEYDCIVGEPSNVGAIDADDGDYVAIYQLVRVQRFETNPRLK